MQRLNLIREERTVRLVYLAVTSRLLPKPISVAVKGPSSGGKTFTVEQTLKLFPESAYHALSAMSERALAYSEEPLAHLMLVLYEAAGMYGDFASYLVRSLLSEGRLGYERVEKTRDGLKPKMIEREGPTGLIVTTTNVHLHPENETRLFSVTVDDSEGQTKAVLSSLATGDTTRGDPALDESRALQTWLECSGNRVSIPYAQYLAAQVPAVAIRMRCDFGAVLSLIRARALLHQATRERDSQGRIVVNFEDYKAIRNLVSEVLSEGVEMTVSKVTRETVATVAELCSDGGQVSLADLARNMSLDRSTVSRRVQMALSRGYLKNLEDKKGRPFKLAIGDQMPEDRDLLPKAEKLECCNVAGDLRGISIPPHRGCMHDADRYECRNQREHHPSGWIRPFAAVSK